MCEAMRKSQRENIAKARRTAVRLQNVNTQCSKHNTKHIAPTNHGQRLGYMALSPQQYQVQCKRES